MPEDMVQKKQKAEFAGAGCFVQALGVVALFFFPIGTVLGVILLIAGSAMSLKTICSRCGNKVEKTSKICPTCQLPLVK